MICPTFELSISVNFFPQTVLPCSEYFLPRVSNALFLERDGTLSLFRYHLGPNACITIAFRCIVMKFSLDIQDPNTF